MIYVTVDYSAECDDRHLNLLGRIVGGLKKLENDGYRVEQYTEFEGRQPQKRILVISREAE
ncbi:MAG: hypothetical protein FWC70_05540 [Defluviitaleaceae bacterium]|nr:hypothetical protein [Defluviitaleaceae bacterium]